MMRPRTEASASFEGVTPKKSYFLSKAQPWGCAFPNLPLLENPFSDSLAVLVRELEGGQQTVNHLLLGHTPRTFPLALTGRPGLMG